MRAYYFSKTGCRNGAAIVRNGVNHSGKTPQQNFSFSFLGMSDGYDHENAF
jgi:hypothetical protein